jgi:hypothetical protein
MALPSSTEKPISPADKGGHGLSTCPALTQSSTPNSLT